jgi:hypothetical protein
MAILAWYLEMSCIGQILTGTVAATWPFIGAVSGMTFALICTRGTAPWQLQLVSACVFMTIGWAAFFLLLLLPLKRFLDRQKA